MTETPTKETSSSRLERISHSHDEPLDPGDIHARWRWVLLAILCALLLGSLAPSTWSSGQGHLTMRVGSQVILAQPVRFGSRKPQTIQSSHRGKPIALTLPKGVPLDRSIVVHFSPTAFSKKHQSSIQLALIPPGHKYPSLLPIVKRDESKWTARRRPPQHVAFVLGLLGLVMILWVTEAIPLYITSLLIPVILAAANVQPANQALAPFFHPVIALFFGGFLMAEAMRRVDLDRLAAVVIVGRFGSSPQRLFWSLLSVAAFLSMWMSNTAATAVLIPIAMAISAPLDNLPFRKTLVLGIAYAATIGGVGSAIGTPANPLAMTFLQQDAGVDIGFVGWFAYGLPMVLCFLPVMGLFLWFSNRTKVDAQTFGTAKEIAQKEVEQFTSFTSGQWQVLLIFCTVMLLWLTQTWHHINTGIVALLGVVLLGLVGQLEPADVKRISWASLLTFGGGLSLGIAMMESGACDWMAAQLTFLAHVPGWLGILLIALIALGLTTAASNTASAAILIPLAIPLAHVIHVNPVKLVIIVAIATSVDFALVIGTPPTMIAYSTELFTTKEIFKRGFALDLIGIGLLVTVVVGCWHILGIL